MAACRSLGEFLDRHDQIVRVVLETVRGSSPREAGAEMLVTDTAIWGTIGGGQLEYMAIDHARKFIAQGAIAGRMEVPLGPEIGQCCGGHVTLSLKLMDALDRSDALNREEAARAQLPNVLILGAGHVGRALARALEPLPVRAILIDSRAIELERAADGCETRLSAIPEMEITNAPTGSAYVVLTHDHALDFLLTSEALARGDAVYVGMIGSATKRASFRSWCRSEHPDLLLDDLICPIGSQGSADKRPEVIAAFVAAEVVAALTTNTSEKQNKIKKNA